MNMATRGALIIWFTLLVSDRSHGQDFLLEPGDHIALVGNTMAERMQHDGWLETFLHLRYPDHRLTFRDLGFSADTLTTRLRSSGFGSPDEHLRRIRADVVIMMFGFNESFAGEAGLSQFVDDLRAEIKRLLSQSYNNRSPPRLVLVSPIPVEPQSAWRTIPSEEINSRLALYTQAMADVAAEHQIRFVDLFHPLAETFGAESGEANESLERAGLRQPLTINGVHLNSRGNRIVAETLVKSLSGSLPNHDAQTVEKVRQAVLDKNFCWFHRYRTTDGYSIFGGRGDLEFVNRQTNREVMMRELEILEAMATNRDPVIWAALRGESVAVDDTQTPPFLEVISNIPGPNPDGSHQFLSGEEAISKMRVLDGFEVTLFASEAEFPELANPVQMAFDTKGRLWVAVWPSYPHWKPKEPMNDKLLILEDTNGDGRADRCTVFADGLHNPTGFEFYDGGVLIAQVPDLWYLKDTNGDDRCDLRERILHGLDSADTHHSANSFVLGPDGALYFQEGVFHRTQVETPYGPVRNIDAACYRFEPRTGRFEVYTAYPYANPHGHVFDQWGRDIIHDGTGSQPYDGALISSRLDFPHKHPGAPQVYQQRTRPCPATEFITAGHFPNEMVGQFLVQNVIGDLGILRYEIKDEGASLTGRELEPLLPSTHRNFRPVDLEFAPDGTLYFIDWHNPIIGHMQHNLRDPNRDKAHGRVYRIRHPDRDLVHAPPENQLTTAELFERLFHGDARSRYRVRIELSSRPADEVLTTARQLETRFDGQRSEDALALLELLWVHQQFASIHRELLNRLLVCNDHRVRSAAVRVMTDWRHELTGVDEWWVRAALDEHPRVRMMAARGASYLRGPVGGQLVAAVAAGERDRFLDYMLREALRGIDPNWKKMMQDADWVAALPPAGAAFLAEQLSPAEMANMALVPNLAQFMLSRPGLSAEKRFDALMTTAQLTGQQPGDLLVKLLEEASQQPSQSTIFYELVNLIPRMDRHHLGDKSGVFAQWAESSSNAGLRQAGMLAFAVITEAPSQIWQMVNRNPALFLDLAAVLPNFPKPEWQWELFPHLVEAAENPRIDWIDRAVESGSYLPRFVRIELPGDQRILTLAEVEVIADGNNVARLGTASQSSVAHGGVPERAIDGNREGRYGAGGQTHTAETTTNPWWEVQLADPALISEVRIFNRTEADFYKRLDGFNLSILDNHRRVLVELRDQTATRRPLEIPIVLPPPSSYIRCVAIKTLSQVPGRESEAFAVLGRIVLTEAPENMVWTEAVLGLSRVAGSLREIENAEALADRLLQHVERTEARHRSQGTPAVAAQLVGTLAGHLPPEEAQRIRHRLSEVVVHEYRLGTRPHRMAFDKTKLVVEAGRTFELVLENTDLMPHNWVLVAPGKLETVGELAEAEAAQPDALQRQYVPDSPFVLAASRLLQPNDAMRVSMAAPSEPGIYPYVCTYPGHWRRMFGALIVVPSTSAYHANPDQYLASLGLEIQDPLLLTVNRQQTEWQLSDLASSVEDEFETGRDFENGRQMFKLASCFSCHKLQGEGYELGPDLLALPAEWSPIDVLNHILEPSQKIDEKFQTQIFQLVSGNTVSGIVIEEDDQTVKIVENPLLEASATMLHQDDIDARRLSDVSIMPKGLLDSLSKEEILDLLAYLIAGGDADHPIFSGK